MIFENFSNLVDSMKVSMTSVSKEESSFECLWMNDPVYNARRLNDWYLPLQVTAEQDASPWTAMSVVSLPWKLPISAAARAKMTWRV